MQMVDSEWGMTTYSVSICKVQYVLRSVKTYFVSVRYVKIGHGSDACEAGMCMSVCMQRSLTHPYVLWLTVRQNVVIPSHCYWFPLTATDSHTLTDSLQTLLPRAFCHLLKPSLFCPSPRRLADCRHLDAPVHHQAPRLQEWLGGEREDHVRPVLSGGQDGLWRGAVPRADGEAAVKGTACTCAVPN